MSESAAWTAIRPVMKGLDPVRIESRTTGSGIPDVNYVYGWIELKYLAAWPKRKTTQVRIEHYTKEQRTWAIKRTQAGGQVLFLLKVGASEWLLLEGARAARVVGNSTREQLYQFALARWTRLPARSELVNWLLPQPSPTGKRLLFGAVAPA